MNRTYGSRPFEIGKHSVNCLEMMMYQYYPIKLNGRTEIMREDRLKPFDKLMGVACCDFIGDFGLDRWVWSYVYLTAKHLWQGPGASFNRPGWHCDGFMGDDIQYVWSNKSPTIFNATDFNLTNDDRLSMLEMEQQAQRRLDYSYENETLLRLDQYCVHRVNQPNEAELRTFFKLSISKDRYDLEGNAHNYLLDYDWPMRPRAVTRNIPQKVGQ